MNEKITLGESGGGGDGGVLRRWGQVENREVVETEDNTRLFFPLTCTHHSLIPIILCYIFPLGTISK